jgi:dephospho-CoA kinase
MLSFHTFKELLNEKLLLINNGKKYGQIVFLAGGAGSGKGFASTNFMNISDFKVRDVDEMKKQYLTLNKLTHKFPELDDLNLRHPKDVFKLHQFVKDKGLVDKTLNNMLNQMKNPDTLPNIVFDVTLKNTKKLMSNIPALLAHGYKTENIHLIWVLTDYKVAVENNRNRSRVVPDDILLQTHVGAHKTMWEIVGKGNIPKEVNGGIYVILNNKENTIFYDTEKGKKSKVIKDFKYLVYKEPGKKPKTDAKIKIQLYTWVTNNVPLTQDGVFA